MNKYITIFTASIAFTALVASCAKEDIDSDTSAGKGQTAKIVATIGDQAIDTKADLRPDGYRDYDPLSFYKFSAGDTMGLYAEGGLDAKNALLKLNESGAVATDLQWGEGYAKNIFSYFPYSANHDELPIWRKDAQGSTTGLEDFLVAKPTKEVVNGTSVSLAYYHEFAMLIILRDNGFILPDGQTNNRDVTVTMSYKISGAKVNMVGPTAKGILLTTGGSDDQATFKATEAKYQGKPAWFVIVPAGTTNATTDSIKVKHITLYKTDGTIEDIIPEKTITPTPNYKYPITALVRNANAEIQPHEIIRWTDNIINIVKLAAISNEGELADWCSAYNSSRSPGNTELIKYGSYANDKWTFLLDKDIVLTGTFNATTRERVIDNFKDIFDGNGYTITNLILKENTGDSKDCAGFIGTLEQSGILRNLILNNALVTGTNNVGALVGINEGSIINCRVTGTTGVTATKNNAGGITGTNKGQITDSKTSAIVYGKSNVDKIAGSTTNDGKQTNCSSSGSVFIQ